uniref:Aquaporin-1 n=2 Tax=Canis lupus familiaris TaxID=9615 RepID=A0A8I3P9I3_CANLF
MASEFKKKLFWRAVVAEFLAMILFVFISIGSALGFNYPVRNNQTAGAAQDNVKVSLAFGLSIATLAQSVGHISGAHLNPAVTLGLLLSCQISILRAVMYIIAQCVGAIVATAILSGITSSLPDNSLGRNELAPGVNSGQGLGIEIIGTLQLVLCGARGRWASFLQAGLQPQLHAQTCSLTLGSSVISGAPVTPSVEWQGQESSTGPRPLYSVSVDTPCVLEDVVRTSTSSSTCPGSFPSAEPWFTSV